MSHHFGINVNLYGVKEGKGDHKGASATSELLSPGADGVFLAQKKPEVTFARLLASFWHGRPFHF